MSSNKLNTLQIGRACAALSVLLLHVEVTLSSPKYIGHVIFPLFNAGKSGIDFFFVLSGFVIILAHERDVGTPARVLPFLWRRFQRIYPPLWAALILVIVIFVVFPSLGRVQARSFANIIEAFTAVPAAHEYLLTTEWTLRYEMVFYLTFAAVILNRKLGVILIGAVLAGSAYAVLVKLPFPASSVFSAYSVLFAIGGVAAVLYSRKVYILPGYMLCVGVVLFVVMWTLVCLNILHINAGPVIIGFGLSSGLIIFGISRLEAKGALTRLPGVLIFLGEASYSIYLVHFPIISVLAKLVLLIGARLRLPDWLVFGLVAIVALSAGIVFHLVIEKPAIRLAARLAPVRNRAARPPPLHPQP